MKYIFHPEALEEYLSAISYYSDINPRLAESFIKAFETGIENIIMFPGAGSIIEKNIRRHPEYWKKRRKRS